MVAMAMDHYFADKMSNPLDSYLAVIGSLLSKARQEIEFNKAYDEANTLLDTSITLFKTAQSEIDHQLENFPERIILPTIVELILLQAREPAQAVVDELLEHLEDYDVSFINRNSKRHLIKKLTLIKQYVTEIYAWLEQHQAFSATQSEIDLCEYWLKAQKDAVLAQELQSNAIILTAEDWEALAQSMESKPSPNANLQKAIINRSILKSL